MTNKGGKAMTDQMPIEDYLAQGGKLSSPANVPARYRGELMRMMATFVDSELAASAGFANAINTSPGIRERIAAARITAEKVENAGRVLDLMADFGTDPAGYAQNNDWAARLPRDADIGATRQGGDMRLSVFHYPLAGWTDAVVMNVLMGQASVIQLGELARGSYQPLADLFRDLLPVERRHLESGIIALRHLIDDPAERQTAKESVAYWRPRVAASFGAAGSGRFDRVAAMGLRHEKNEDMAARWHTETDTLLSQVGLN